MTTSQTAARRPRWRPWPRHARLEAGISESNSPQSCQPKSRCVAAVIDSVNLKAQRPLRTCGRTAPARSVHHDDDDANNGGSYIRPVGGSADQRSGLLASNFRSGALAMRHAAPIGRGANANTLPGWPGSVRATPDLELQQPMTYSSCHWQSFRTLLASALPELPELEQTLTKTEPLMRWTGWEQD